MRRPLSISSTFSRRRSRSEASLSCPKEGCMCTITKLRGDLPRKHVPFPTAPVFDQILQVHQQGHCGGVAVFRAAQVGAVSGRPLPRHQGNDPVADRRRVDFREGRRPRSGLSFLLFVGGSVERPKSPLRYLFGATKQVKTSQRLRRQRSRTCCSTPPWNLVQMPTRVLRNDIHFHPRRFRFYMRIGVERGDYPSP